MDGALVGDGEAGKVAAGPAGGVGLVGTAGVELVEVEVRMGETLATLLMVIGAGTAGVLIKALMALVDKSSMAGSPLVGSLSMGSVFEMATESGVETVVMKGGRTRRPLDFKISLILSCWTPMWRRRRPELAKVF